MIQQIADVNTSNFRLQITDGSNTVLQEASYNSANHPKLHPIVTANIGTNSTIKLKVINDSGTNVIVFDSAYLNILTNLSVFEGTMEMWVKRDIWTSTGGADCNYFSVGFYSAATEANSFYLGHSDTNLYWVNHPTGVVWKPLVH